MKPRTRTPFPSALTVALVDGPAPFCPFLTTLWTLLDGHPDAAFRMEELAETLTRDIEDAKDREDPWYAMIDTHLSFEGANNLAASVRVIVRRNGAVTLMLEQPTWIVCSAREAREAVAFTGRIVELVATLERVAGLHGPQER